MAGPDKSIRGGEQPDKLVESRASWRRTYRLESTRFSFKLFSLRNCHRCIIFTFLTLPIPFPSQTRIEYTHNTNQLDISVCRIAEARSFLFVGFSRAVLLGLFIVHQRTYVRGGCAVSPRERKEKGKRRKGRREESERKNGGMENERWQTASLPSPGRGGTRLLPRFLRARGGKDTHEYAMRNTVIVRLVNATWRRNRTMASKKSLCPPGKSFSRVMKILLGRDE